MKMGARGKRFGAGILGLAVFMFVAMQVPARADHVDTVRVAVVSNFVGGQLELLGLDYIVDKQGWLRDELAKHGVKLEWYPAPTAAVGPMINEAFANHLIQFASYSDLPAIILNGSGAAVHTTMLVPGAPSDSYLVVPTDSTAKTIEDLKGKRLAIHKGRPWEIPLLRLLDAKKLSYADFQVYNINPDAGATAVATGAIDGLFTYGAYALEEKGVAKIIWSTKDSPLDWKSWGGFWGARDFVAQNPDIAQIVVTAYVKAAYYAAQDANRDELIKLGTRLGASEAVVRRTYEDPTLSWKDRWSPLFSKALYDHYRADAAYAIDKKIIRKPVDVDQLLDPHLMQAALADLKLQDYWTARPDAAP